MSQPPILLTAMVTPFDADLEIDLGLAKALAQRLVEEGSDGIVVCGTTGESPTLTDDEKVALFGAIVDAVGGKATVIAGAGDNNTARSLTLTARATDAGVDGVMFTAPSYNKPPQDCLVRHFATLAASTPLPAMLYHIPGRAVTRLEPATVLKLARECETVVAIKDAGSDMNYTAAIRRGAPEGFTIYSGNDGETLPMLALGARGVVSVASHVVGPRMRRMIEAFQAGDTRTALSEHLACLPVFDALFQTTSPIPVKAACELRGIAVGGLRPPLYEASPELRERLAATLREAGIL